MAACEKLLGLSDRKSPSYFKQANALHTRANVSRNRFEQAVHEVRTKND
jgi:hypothetical protein